MWDRSWAAAYGPTLRERADYEATHVSQTQAGRARSRAQEFVSAVVTGGEQQ